LYVYIPYILGVPFNLLFLPHLLLVVLSAYTLIGLLAAIDGEAVRQRLGGFVPVRIAAGIFIALGIFILLRQTVLIIGAVAGGEPVGMLERATFVADFAVLPMLIAAGVLLWRRAPLGYAAGPGLLLGYGLLALSLVPFFVVQSRHLRPADRQQRRGGGRGDGCAVPGAIRLLRACGGGEVTAAVVKEGLSPGGMRLRGPRVPSMVRLQTIACPGRI
jgi:hypothetical protein